MRISDCGSDFCPSDLGLSASTADKSEYYISRMGPVIARLPIAEMAAPDLLAVLRRIEAQGNYETARRVLQLARRVFRYAVATARLASDPRDRKRAVEGKSVPLRVDLGGRGIIKNKKYTVEASASA